MFKTVIFLPFFAYPGVLCGFGKSSHQENPGLVISDKNQALNLTNLYDNRGCSSGWFGNSHLRNPTIDF